MAYSGGLPRGPPSCSRHARLRTSQSGDVQVNWWPWERRGRCAATPLVRSEIRCRATRSICFRLVTSSLIVVALLWVQAELVRVVVAEAGALVQAALADGALFVATRGFAPRAHVHATPPTFCSASPSRAPGPRASRSRAAGAGSDGARARCRRSSGVTAQPPCPSGGRAAAPASATSRPRG